MPAKVTELELEVLYKVSRMVGRALDLDQVLHEVLQALGDHLHMQRATLVLAEPGGRLRIAASHGLSPQEAARGVYSPDEGVTGRIFQTGRPFYCPDAGAEPLFLNRTGARDLDRQRIAFVGVPIMLDEKAVGVLTVDRLFGSEVSPDEDIRFLTIVGQIVGQFVELNRAVAARELGLRRQNSLLAGQMAERGRDAFAQGPSAAMAEARELMDKVAPSGATVLLTGEPGAGKALAARLIHHMSSRSGGPFVQVNCALPEAVLAAELFGRAGEGAEPQAGRLQEAGGGTIYLENVGGLSPTLQAKLLRFLQDREFEPLGSTETRKVDTRVIAAVGADLAAEVADGRFRQDLYYMLAVFPIRVPALRERREDIPGIVTRFLAHYAGRHNRDMEIDEQALALLAQYDWPGNLRELENLVERLVIMWQGPRITLAQLPSFVFYRARQPQPTLHGQGELSRLEEMEKREVVAALERNNWVQSRAAGELGITLRQLGYRIKKFGMEKTVKERRRRAAAARVSGHASP